MAGKKGRSGRQPLEKEIMRRMVLDKSWAITAEFLRSPKFELDKKVDQAIKIVTKDMPTVVEGNPARPIAIVEFMRKTVNGTD